MVEEESLRFGVESEFKCMFIKFFNDKLGLPG
jgi:hypothetical protein